MEKTIQETKPVIVCPYCNGTQVIKKGTRKKKHEIAQLYFCHHCDKKFTPLLSKYKTFPMRIILASITLYNRLNTLDESARIVTEKYGIPVSAQNVKNWCEGYKEYLPFLRLRPFVEKKYDRRNIIEQSRLFHGQIYDFKYHRAKSDLIITEDFKHYRFRPLQEFLELVTAECPHGIFKKGGDLRASSYKDVFDLTDVKIVHKDNAAVKNARFVLQAVANNKMRHEALQEFMLANDSVTVAVEVPVLLDHDDVAHYQNMLGFNVPLTLGEDEVITGHIDAVQIRNGMVHIMDFKPSARKDKPIAQLMIYALALSRLTTLRLFHFKCAWFDDEDYYEFYPLHVVYKKKRGKKRR